MWPFKKKKQTDFPPAIQAYQRLDFKVPKDVIISKATYVVLDCETTGVERSDEIITIGAVCYKQQSIDLGQVLDLRRSLACSSPASTIHGELALKARETESNLMVKTLDFLSNHILVGHHVSFDVQMLQGWISTHYPGFKIKNPVIDTLRLIKRLDPQRIERRVAGHDVLQLDALCLEYGIEVENRHTALGDAYMTAQLLHQLIYQLEKRGVKQLCQIAE